MAPEQLEGKEADARTDILAFGCVLYEMVTGQRAFEGKSQASLIAAILKDEPPPISSHAAATPPALDRWSGAAWRRTRTSAGRAARDLAAELKWSWDIWILPLAGDRKPFPFLRTPFDEGPALFSPDGRWIAYNSDETGRNEIYVAPFPGPGGKWQVSSDGGSNPRWRRDGTELFYVSPDQKVMAVGVRAGPGFKSAAPVPLFAARFLNHLYYDVSADGQRFLVETEVPEEPTPLTLVVNWTAGLER